jgi:hypothetical protein
VLSPAPAWARVGEFPAFTSGWTYVPTAADVGKALEVRFIAFFSWSWYTVQTIPRPTTQTRIIYDTAVEASAKVRAKRNRPSVVIRAKVSGPGLPAASGTLTISERGKTLRTRELKVGVARFVLRPTKGRHTYVLSFPGSDLVDFSSNQVKVRVR